MKKKMKCPKCGSRNVIIQKDGSLFDRIVKVLAYDYECQNCYYQWDEDYPDDGWDPSKKKDDSDDDSYKAPVICDVPPII